MNLSTVRSAQLISAVCSAIDEPMGGISFRFPYGKDERGVNQMCLAFAPEPSESVWGLILYADGTGAPPQKLREEGAKMFRSHLQPKPESGVLLP